jgi:2-iminobutanoate/2-iminopropanoate deaminase
MSRRTINVDGIVPIARDYPSAVISNGLVFISGVRGSRREGQPCFGDLPADFRRIGFSGQPIADQLEGEFAADAFTAHENLDRVVRSAGSDPLQVLRLHIWMRDKRLFPVYERIRMAWQSVPAPSSCLGVAAVPGRFGRNAGIDAIAVVPNQNSLFPGRSTVRAFDDQEFPAAAFFSQAVRCGPLVTLAGFIPIATNRPGAPAITGFADLAPEQRFMSTGRSHTDSRQGPIAAQTIFTYQAIQETLAMQGLGLEHVTHVAVMLQDLRDFGAFHRVHQHVFPESGPAMTVMGFNEVGHKGTLIEIEATAAAPIDNFSVSAVPWPIVAPFAGPAAMRMGPLCFFAGMLGLNSAGQIIREATDLEDPIARHHAADLDRYSVTPGFAAQAFAAWDLLARVCATGSIKLSHIAKMTVSMRDPRDLWIFEEVRSAFLPSDSLPAIEFVAIQGPGPVAAAAVQIEAIASVDH